MEVGKALKPSQPSLLRDQLHHTLASGPGWDPRGGQHLEAAERGLGGGGAAGGAVEHEGHCVPRGEG